MAIGWLSGAGRWIRDHYCTIDPRTLGAFRLVHGFLLAADCIRHWSEASWAYSNEGVVSNHYNLFVTYHPESYHLFSIYHAFSSLPEVHVAFALSLACYLCYFVGFKARLFSILSFVLVTSMDSRLAMVENGGYVVVNVLTCWAMFLPTGARFSVDAWLRSYRERRERTAADLNERVKPAWATRPFVSGAVLVVILNLAAIYYFNVVNKSGQIWRRGDTVHYVLHLDRMVTGLAVFVREHFPLWSTRVMSWTTLTLEALILAWIMSPYGRRVTRPLAMLGMVVLHGTFGVMMRLGPFSWFMICWSVLLLTPIQWEGLERWYRRRAAPRVVVYDEGSPLAFAMARVLARLDSLSLLRFEAAGAGAGGGRPELLAVRDVEGGSTFTGARALREIAQALPGGRFAWPVLSVMTLGMAGRLLAAAARRRDGLARFFGLGRVSAGAPPSAAPAWVGRVSRVAREVVVAYLALCAVSDLLNQNKSVPAALKHQAPRFVRMTIGYPRMHQRWDMFSANPITDDGILAVDAITADGRHVDPFTGEAPDLNLSDARGLGLGQIRQDYFNRIRLDHNKVYRKPQGLQEWLLRHHERTGRKEDEIVAFDVFWLRDQCPRPGESQPYGHEAIPILSYRKPRYRPPPGVAPLPPLLKEKSAGK